MRAGYLVPKGLTAQQEIIRRSSRKTSPFFVLVYNPALHFEAITDELIIPNVKLASDSCLGRSLLIECHSEIETRAVFVSLNKIEVRCAIFINGKEIAYQPKKS